MSSYRSVHSRQSSRHQLSRLHRLLDEISSLHRMLEDIKTHDLQIPVFSPQDGRSSPESYHHSPFENSPEDNYSTNSGRQTAPLVVPALRLDLLRNSHRSECSSRNVKRQTYCSISNEPTATSELHSSRTTHPADSEIGRFFAEIEGILPDCFTTTRMIFKHHESLWKHIWKTEAELDRVKILLEGVIEENDSLVRQFDLDSNLLAQHDELMMLKRKTAQQQTPKHQLYRSPYSISNKRRRFSRTPQLLCASPVIKLAKQKRKTLFIKVPQDSLEMLPVSTMKNQAIQCSLAPAKATRSNNLLLSSLLFSRCDPIPEESPQRTDFPPDADFPPGADFPRRADFSLLQIRIKKKWRQLMSYFSSR